MKVSNLIFWVCAVASLVLAAWIVFGGSPKLEYLLFTALFGLVSKCWDKIGKVEKEVVGVKTDVKWIKGALEKG